MSEEEKSDNNSPKRIVTSIDLGGERFGASPDLGPALPITNLIQPSETSGQSTTPPPAAPKKD